MENTRLDKKMIKKEKQENKKNRKDHKKQLKVEKKEAKKQEKDSATILNKVLRVILYLFSFLILGIIIFLTVFLYKKVSILDTTVIDKQDIEINTEVIESGFGEGYFNVALFGGDSRTGNLESGTLSDTIMVASLNNKTKEVRIASIYRDTMLNIGDGSYNKANAAYAFGGPTKAINMLNTNLDLNLEKYVAVDFSIMVDIVDELGGLELEIDKNEISAINKYIPETARVAGVEANLITTSGLQMLDGAQATTYARIRSTAGGDFKRTDRQRYVIEQLIKTIKRSNLLTINKIIDLALPRISTNFTATEIAYYAAAYLDFELGSSTGFPEKYSTGTVPGLGSTVVPQTLVSNVQILHEFLFDIEDYTPSSTVVSNGNDIAYKAGGHVGGVGNSNSGYSTHSTTSTMVDGEGFMSNYGEEEKKFNNPEITFE